MRKVSLKEILKSDVSILNKYFLVTLIFGLLTVVGYTSYALFSYEEVSNTGIRLKYSGSIKQSEGNLANDWKDKTENETSYLAIYTLDNVNFPSTYNYDGTTYTLSTTIDVSEQENGNVLLTEYKNGSNYIAIFGQDGGVVAPVDSQMLFSLKYTGGPTMASNLKTIDLSNFNTSNVANMAGMFYGCVGLTEIDLSGFDTSNVTSMYNLFGFCRGFTTLDLSSFETSNVTNMAGMFYGCTKLTSVTVGCNWVIDSSASITNMFAQAGVSEVTKVCNE